MTRQNCYSSTLSGGSGMTEPRAASPTGEVSAIHHHPADAPTVAIIRAYHLESGSVLTGEVTDTAGVEPHRMWRVIPEGLLEAVQRAAHVLALRLVSHGRLRRLRRGRPVLAALPPFDSASLSRWPDVAAR